MTKLQNSEKEESCEFTKNGESSNLKDVKGLCNLQLQKDIVVSWKSTLINLYDLVFVSRLANILTSVHQAQVQDHMIH